MELRNISSFNEFKQQKVNEEFDMFGIGAWLSKKFGNSMLGKLFNKFETAIKNEKDPKKLVNFLQTFLQEQQQEIQTELKKCMSSNDVRNLVINNLESTYTAIGSIGQISDVGGKFKATDLFATKKDLAAALSQPKEKAISDPSKNLVGSIQNYVDTVLMPNLKQMSGVKESFLFEEANPVTPPAAAAGSTPPTAPAATTPAATPPATTPPATTPPTTTPPAAQTPEKPGEQPAASGTTTPPTKEQLKPGAVVTYKNKQNQVVRGTVSSNQDGVTGTQVKIDPIKESVLNEDVVDVASVTTIEKEAPTQQPPEIAKLGTNLVNWLNTTFYKPIFDKSKEIEQGAPAAGQQGNLANYNNPKVTTHPDTVMKMAQSLRDMDKEKLVATRDFIAQQKGLKDPKNDLGTL